MVSRQPNAMRLGVLLAGIASLLHDQSVCSVL